MIKVNLLPSQVSNLVTKMSGWKKVVLYSLENCNSFNDIKNATKISTSEK